MGGYSLGNMASYYLKMSPLLLKGAVCKSYLSPVILHGSIVLEGR